MLMEKDNSFTKKGNFMTKFIKMFNFLICVFLCLLIISCKSGYNLKQDQTIIKPDASDLKQWKNAKAFEPSGSDIETAETLLKKGFDEQARGTVNRVLGKKPEDYYQQFVGFIDESGDKIIWINCFCKNEISSFPDWKNKIVYVADGGNCFVNIKVNISKNSVVEFNVNGVA